MSTTPSLIQHVRETFADLSQVVSTYDHLLRPEEVGQVIRVGHGVVTARGLPDVRLNEVVRFPGNKLGIAFDLRRNELGVVLLDPSEGIASGAEIRRTHKVLDVPVGEGILGRVVDGVGRPLDGKGALSLTHRLPVEREAPPIMHRDPVTVPLQTGIKVIDALIPVGKGQRELILGDRQTGKTAIAVDTILNQRDKNVLCIYCAVGGRGSAVAKLIADLQKAGAMEYSSVVIATENDPPGLQYVTPYAAMSMGEYFLEKGQDVLVILDDLTRHARAYRELALLLRRPPGREAFPGDIFYLHSRLLERSTHLRSEFGGGSLTALPICETEAQNLAAYIPTNLISITDGQIYLSPDLFQKSVLPAIDVGKSVSRVGGKTQLQAFRQVAGDLRLSYSQFEELESFASFGTRLDDATHKALERGRRVREVLKQDQYLPQTITQQIAAFVSVTSGEFDPVPTEQVNALADQVGQTVEKRFPSLRDRIEGGDRLTETDKEAIRQTVKELRV